MSHIIVCDVCGIHLSNGKGVYSAKIDGESGSPHKGGGSYRNSHYDLCLKCAKPLLEWKKQHPKQPGTYDDI